MMLKKLREYLEQSREYDTQHVVFISVYISGSDELVQYNFPDIRLGDNQVSKDRDTRSAIVDAEGRTRAPRPTHPCLNTPLPAINYRPLHGLCWRRYRVWICLMSSRFFYHEPKTGTPMIEIDEQDPNYKESMSAAEKPMHK